MGFTLVHYPLFSINYSNICLFSETFFDFVSCVKLIYYTLQAIGLRLCCFFLRNILLLFCHVDIVFFGSYIFAGLGICSVSLCFFTLSLLLLFNEGGSKSLLLLFFKRVTRAKWVDHSFHFFEHKSDLLFMRERFALFRRKLVLKKLFLSPVFS